MVKRLRIPRYRYAAWWSVVLGISLLSGTAAVGYWQRPLLYLVGGPGLLVAFAAKYLIPILLWERWCRAPHPARRTFSQASLVAFFTLLLVVAVSAFFRDILIWFTGPFAEYGERKPPLPAWLIREYVEEFFVTALAYDSAFAVFAAFRLWWRRAFLLYRLYRTSRRWALGTAMLLGVLTLAGIGKMAIDFVRNDQARRDENAFALFLLVCVFGVPLAASLLGLGRRRWTRWPLGVCLAITALIWGVLGILHVLRFGNRWMFDWSFVWYSLLMFAVSGIQLADITVQAVKAASATQTTTAPQPSRSTGYRRAFPWWMYPVIVLGATLGGYLASAATGTEEVSRILVFGLSESVLFLCVGVRCLRLGCGRPVVEPLMLLALIGAMLTILSVASNRCPRWFMDRVQCNSQLQAIWVALGNYHEKSGRYPPVAVKNAKGEPVASWRMLLLPHLDKNLKLDAYRMNEPWDSTNNAAVCAKLANAYFRCPATNRRNEDPTRVDYLAVVGPNTFWSPEGAGRNKTEIAHPEATAVLMEVVDSSIRWCQPSDVTFEDLVSDKFSWDRTAAHGRVEDCFAHAVPFTNILFADGSIREFGGKPNDEELRQLFSLDGQYPFKKYEGTYRFADAAPPPDKPRIAVFRVWAVCFALVFLFAFLPVAGRRRSLLTNKD